jgi:predicted Rossmann fold nucleotide-binding protein DprA/Smf involved in DNA uptake
LGSFSQIFEGKQPVKNTALNQQLQIIRKAYLAGHWQSAVEKIEKTLDQFQAQILPISSPDYPSHLQQIAKPPPLLYVRGNINSLHLPQIAIVGSRRMTRGAEITAKSWGKSLAASGFAITSGMAIGIDSSTHKGALEAPQGISIGVIATGIDRMYLSRNTDLAENIIEKGGRPSDRICPRHTPSAGPLASYGEKYKYLTTVPKENSSTTLLSDEESQLLELLDYQPLLVDELVTPWSMDKLSQLLIALELKGAIVSEQGYFSRV